MTFIIQVLFFLVLFLCSRYKFRDILLQYMTIIWVVSSIFSVLYFNAMYFGDNTFYIEPLIYFDICILLFVAPLPKLQSMAIEDSDITINNINRLMLLLGIISILPFVENIIYLLTTYSAQDSSIVDMYQDKMDADVDAKKLITWLSWPSKICQSINSKFEYLTPFLLFYIMTKNTDLKDWRFLVYSIAVINPVIFGVNRSGRGAAFAFILTIVFLYLFFKKNIVYRPSKKVKICALGALGCVISALLIITILRFNNSTTQDDLLIWSSLYLGEGQVNFMTQMWDGLKMSTLGDNSFSFFKQLIGSDTFTDMLDRREYWNENKIGISPVRFYTFIGSWFYDFRYYTIVFVCILSFLMNKMLNNKISIVKLFVIYLYCRIFYTGFTIYPYLISALTMNIFISIAALYICTKFKFK